MPGKFEKPRGSQPREAKSPAPRSRESAPRRTQPENVEASVSRRTRPENVNASAPRRTRPENVEASETRRIRSENAEAYGPQRARPETAAAPTPPPSSQEEQTAPRSIPPVRRRRKPKKPNYFVPAVLGFLVVVALGIALWRLLPPGKEPAPETSTPSQETRGEIPHVVSTATVSSTGDLLIHRPIIKAAIQEDESYDFGPVFQYLKPYSQKTDFAIANLETTLAGDDKPYQGNPLFNCPDSIVDALKDVGFDLLLTANNHSYDTEAAGYLRTLETIRGAGLETLGTMAGPEDPKYTIQEINGIKIGMFCYTYEDSDGTGESPALNYQTMKGLTYDNINCYRPADPQSMYDEVETYLAEMKSQGVEATIMYIHWGPQEYALTQPAAHIAIAQKLCDLGIDVIVGGHPHVVQPMDLLTSTVDPSHKTVCLYSMGNAVSNQRLGAITAIDTAHTEDGVWFSVTFSKYSDGSVYVDSVELIPTWVYLVNNYYILPLDIRQEADWQTMFSMGEVAASAAKDSYNRTMEQVGSGLAKCQEYLAQQKALREGGLSQVPDTAPESTGETLPNAA